MKFINLLAFFVVILVAGTTALLRICPQRARPPTCVGPLNVGTRCPTAPPRRMWYYNQTNRTCMPMQHLGCGGNANRWCTRLACELVCNRQTTSTTSTTSATPTNRSTPTTNSTTAAS